MTTEEITREYNELVATIEEANIYDGRGVYDLYRCETCGNHKITLYKDKGVTPFIIGCDRCKGHMSHTSSSRKEPIGATVHNWVRPTLEQTLKLSEGRQEHVLNGGLILEEDLTGGTISSMNKGREPDSLLFDNPSHYEMPAGNQYYKGSSTKAGNSRKDIAKRRKRNKNRKTHRR